MGKKTIQNIMILRSVINNIKRHGELFFKHPYLLISLPLTLILFMLKKTLSKKKFIVFEASQNYFYHTFEPAYNILKKNPHYEIYFAYRFRDNDCADYFKKRGVPEKNIIWAEIAKYLPFDLFISHDLSGNTFPLSFLKTVKIQMFHGIGSVNMDKLQPNLSRFDYFFEIGQHYNEIHNKWKEVSEQKIKLFNIGYPKTDVIFNKNYNADEIKKRLNIHLNMPVILFSPHWSPESGIHRFGRKTTDILLNENYFVIMKLHNYIFREYKEFSWQNVIEEYKKKYANFYYCDEPDTQQYYLISDALISDAGSTTPFEFMLTGKPAILFTADKWFAKYGKLMPEFEVYSAAIKIESPDELPELLKNNLIKNSVEKDRIKQIADKYLYNHGKASEAAALAMEQILENKRA